jgi:hypothetical protein
MYWVLRGWLLLARLHRTPLLSEVALVSSEETATAPLPPDMLAVPNYACSYARPCSAAAGLDYAITQALISRTCQLGRPRSFLQVMQE